MNPQEKQDWLKERLEVVTSTEVSALFDISPYMTRFELWHKKKNKDVGEINENERMKWGTRLQESIALGIGVDNGWEVNPFTEFKKLDGLKIGSSFDYQVLIPMGANEGEDDLTALLEIKNVDALAFRDGWLIDGENIEAPPHIELQVQHQLLVSGYKKAYIGALVGGNKVFLIERTADEEIFEQIKIKVKEFWKSIEDGIEPEPDFKRDSEFISKLYNKADIGSVAYADEDVSNLVALYHHAAATEKVAEKQKDEYKAKILIKIGKTSKVMGETFTISSGEVKEAVIPTYTRKGYRLFKINFKKDGIND